MNLTFKKGVPSLDNSQLIALALDQKGVKELKGRNSDKSLLKKIFKSDFKRILQRLDNLEFTGKFGQLASFDIVNDSGRATRLLVIGSDTQETRKFDLVDKYRKLGAMIRDLTRKEKVGSVTLVSESLDWTETDNQNAFLEGLILSSYSYNRYKSKSSKEKIKLNKVVVYCQKFATNRNLKIVEALCAGTFLARDLVNTPPIDCPPAELVRAAKQIARKQRLKIDVYNRSALKRMGAGGILGVSMASANEPYMIRLQYKPKNKRAKKVAIVGKGITFDSGGLSIKPGTGMETMKCDMSGAAAVLGAMSVIREVAPNVAVTAYVPTCENMIAANAMRPGDIIKIMNGTTIEVLNTDAEGRLILADALTLAAKDKNETIIDLATLTGACVVALGNDYAGMFTNDPKLGEKIQLAGEKTGERYWPLPLAQEYLPQLKSPIADFKNIGNRGGAGAITAALFLQQFVEKDTKWAHLDIAGPAFKEGAEISLGGGGIGFGVRTLLTFLAEL